MAKRLNLAGFQPDPILMEWVWGGFISKPEQAWILNYKRAYLMSSQHINNHKIGKVDNSKAKNLVFEEFDKVLDHLNSIS